MRPRFPGMDPWLEHPGLWPGVHNRLITAIADDLVPKVAPRYFVDVDPAAAGTGPVAMKVELPVEVEVDVWYLEVRSTRTGKLITVIEVLSPTNKTADEGRRKYLRKRRKIFKTRTSLVEIDLIRGGRPMPLTSREPVEGDYRILVSRGASRPLADLYTFGVRHPIPPIPIPLLPKDPEPSLDLGAVLHALYDRARLDLRIDYTKLPVPPLAEEDTVWARGILAGRAEARGDRL